MLKKIFLSLLFLYSAAAAYGAAQLIGGRWGGLNNGDTSINIEDNEAQDLLNVDMSVGGTSIIKRDGYTQFKQLQVSTSAPTSAYKFTDIDSDVNLIHAHNVYVSASVDGSAYTNFITTGTIGAHWDFTDSQGYLYGANTSNHEIWRYDGASVTYFPSTPKGTQVEFTVDRLVISGTTANPMRLHFSKLVDPTLFTVGNNSEDPWTEDLNFPGEKVYALRWIGDRLLIWTDSAFGFWYGSDQFNSVLEIISNTVGTQQPDSIIFDEGIVYWQGQDNHFYGYDSSTYKRISDKITGSVEAMVLPGRNTWTVETQAEFGEGTFGTALSSTTQVGEVTMDVVVKQDTSNSAVPGLCSEWVAQSFQYTQSFIPTLGSVYTNVLGNPGSVTAYVSIRADDGSNSPSTTALSTATISLTTAGGNAIHQLAFSPAVSLSANTTYWVYIATISGCSGVPSTNNYFWRVQTTNPYVNGRLKNAANTSAYSGYDAYFSVGNSSAVYLTTHTLLSTGITSWGQFLAGYSVADGDSIAFVLYSDTNSAINTANATTFTASQTITSGSIPSISTGSYATLSAVFTRSASTNTSSLNDLTLNYYEGVVPRTYVALDRDFRIFWSVVENSATKNNAVYVYDRRFPVWLKYDMALTAPIKDGESIYFGGVSTGVIYTYPSGNTDNGSAITAYWQSKDFLSQDAFVEKQYNNFSFLANTNTGSNLDITYEIDASTTVTYNVSLTDPNNLAIRRYNRPFPIGTFGTFINVKFGNDDADAAFTLHVLKYEYDYKRWRVLE